MQFDFFKAFIFNKSNTIYKKMYFINFYRNFIIGNFLYKYGLTKI